LEIGEVITKNAEIDRRAAGLRDKRGCHEILRADNMRRPELGAWGREFITARDDCDAGPPHNAHDRRVCRSGQRQFDDTESCSGRERSLSLGEIEALFANVRTGWRLGGKPSILDASVLLQ